jgi:CUB/sushi domain-containing protein
LVIHDYSGFDVYINNERYTTDVDADDGKWHHIAFSWASSSGQVILYKDGSPVSQGTIQRNKVSYSDQT